MRFALMERAGHFHGLCHVIWVVVVERFAVVDVIRELPSRLRVLVDERGIEVEVTGNVFRKRFTFSIDELGRIGAGMAIYVPDVPHAKAA